MLLILAGVTINALFGDTGIINKANELKQKILKSVYENGGFWIGRYEAGITTHRTSSKETITEEAPLSKAGTVENPIYPCTWITCSQTTSNNFVNSSIKQVQSSGSGKGILLTTL